MNKRRVCILAIVIILVIITAIILIVNQRRSSSANEAASTESETASTEAAPVPTEEAAIPIEVAAVSTEEGTILTETASVPKIETITAEVLRDSVEIGDVRVQVLSDSVVRIELKNSEGEFENRSTYHIVNRDFGGTEYTVNAESDLSVISTSQYSVHVPNNADILDGIYITDKSGVKIWQYTSLPDAQQYLPAPGDTGNVWAIADNPRVVPAEWGYSPMPGGTSDNGYNGWDTESAAPDMYIFIPYKDAKKLRSDFIKLTGATEMVSLKTLGLWHSRFYQYSEASALATAQKYRDEGFPLDNFVVDTDWRINASHGYEINPIYFPDPERFFDKMHNEQQVNVFFNDHPEPQNNQHALSQADLNYRNSNLSRILNLGLDSWWFDRNWPVSIISPFSGINKESFGMYLYQEITQKSNPNQRAIILGNVDGIDNGVFNRAPNLASHRFSVQWTGDIGQTSEALQREIVAAVRSGAVTSVPYVSADVGGHYGMQSPELFTRWTQFAAFAPIFRYHSVIGEEYDRSPWLYGDDAEDTAREYINMRYRLIPLFYSLSHENYETGMPLLRRLDYNYPQYAESQNDSQYTLGDNILIAPINEGGKEQVIPPSWLSYENQTGFKAEYFNNTNLSGEPVVTKIETELSYNWGTGKPDTLINEDNFSVRWTGKIKAGNEPARLSLKTDDGVRLYVDGKIVINKWEGTNSVTNIAPILLEAGSEHDIVIEYYEGSGNAVMEFKCITISPEGDSRDIFIPDGRWIDVWTGETIEGPQTITQSHMTSTSPIFVRSGTIIPLADNVKYLGEKKWNNITLDVYPSTQLIGKAQLYEDDTVSNEYKEGNFRTTELSASYDNSDGEVLVNIGKTEGSFTGSDEITSRNWTVRIHAPSDFGDVISCKLDGEAVTPVKISKSENVSPFAISGGALDSDIYEITFSKPLTESSELRIKFASPKDENLPAANNNDIYYTSETKSIGAAVDLSAFGKSDWIHYGTISVESFERKTEDTQLISNLAITGTASLYTGLAEYIWEDNNRKSKNGISVTNGQIEFDIDIGTPLERISLFLCGSDTDGILEISDGNSVKLVTIQSEDGAYEKRVTIDAYSTEAGKLHIKYRNANKLGSIALMAAAVGDPSDEPDNSVELATSIEIATSGINLSEPEIKDWVHLGLNGDVNAVNRKDNADRLLTNPVYSDNLMPVHDFPEISFSDGTPSQTASNTRNAVTAYQGSISFSAPSKTTWQELKIYTGAYESANTIEISDDAGHITTLEFSAQNVTQQRVITVKFRSQTDSRLYIKSIGTGHMFIAAYTVSDINE